MVVIITMVDVVSLSHFWILKESDYFRNRSVLIWKKSEDKSVQLVKGSFVPR